MTIRQIRTGVILRMKSDWSKWEVVARVYNLVSVKPLDSSWGNPTIREFGYGEIKNKFDLLKK